MKEFAIAAVVAAAVASCGGGSNTSSSTAPTGTTTTSFGNAPLVFRASPIDQSAIRWITPLGNLNPPDHTLPTDHIYFYFAAPNLGEQPAARRTAFFAPADGTVTTVFGGAQVESKVLVRVSATVQDYIDHLILEAPLHAADARGSTHPGRTVFLSQRGRRVHVRVAHLHSLIEGQP